MGTPAHRQDVARTALLLAHEVNEKTEQQHDRNQEHDPGCQRSTGLITNLDTLLRKFIQYRPAQRPTGPITQPVPIHDDYFIPIHIDADNVLLCDVRYELCEWHRYMRFLRLLVPD